MSYPKYSLSIDNYHLDPWNENIELANLFYAPEWMPFFKREIDEEYFEDLEKKLKRVIKNGNTVYPPPAALINIFYRLPPRRIKVVILGQDPYPGCYNHNGYEIPHATGISFSIPYGVPITSSLTSVFNNMKKYGHISKIPDHGNLNCLIEQGCFFINTSLTVVKSNPGSHRSLWVNTFGKHLIEYLSKNLNNLVFVLWGKDALNMKQYIDSAKHSFVISSHPSGQGAYSYVTDHNSAKPGKEPKKYPPFVEVDHWTAINEHLINYKKKPIIWEALNIVNH